MTSHTIMVREHNRGAGILYAKNPQWSDEIVFQEARRVFKAQIQQITCNEYLPILLRHEKTAFLNLLPGSLFLNKFEHLCKSNQCICCVIWKIRPLYDPIPVFSRRWRLWKRQTHAIHAAYAYFKANSLYDSDQGGMV
ncbi:Chorion peroxidase [Brachionus plicatilis]|uniref:Chorion peroxidase n=1 Tax=Brachionus plicatilis TaxID=10195 RepID=A0A3M7PS27_BRAPC|nr:Chorion peroxidase [Brachionus plicatilis]